MKRREGANIVWDDLRFFLAVARAGSLSRAARRLRVGIATVGRHLDRLEEELDLKLFDRTPNGLARTEAGARLVARAEEVEERVARLVGSAADVRGDKLAGVVRVSTIETMATAVIAPRVAAFADAYPDIALQLVAETRSVSLARREADLAVRFAPPRGGSLIGRRIATIATALYASRAYLDRHGVPEAPDASLAGHRLVGLDPRMDHQAEGAWLAARAEGANYALRATSYSAMLTATVAGVGLAMLPTFLAADEPELVRLIAPAALPRRECWLVMHEDMRRAAPVRAVADFLVDTIGRRVSGDGGDGG